MQIREYCSSDSSDVLNLIIELQDYEHGIDPRVLPGKEVADEYFSYLFTKVAEQEGKIFLGVDDGIAIGFVCVIVEKDEPALNEVSTFGYVTDLGVASTYRSQGIGRRLLDEAKAYIKGLGLSYLKLNVKADNTLARNFYRKQGFEEEEISLITKV